LQQAGRWGEALAAARRAEAVLDAGGGSLALRQQARGKVADLTLLAGLEGARLAATAVKDNKFDREAGVARFLGAFREYGIDLEALAEEEAAGRIAASDIPGELTVALEEWALALIGYRGRAGKATGVKLLAVADRVDGEPVRREWRAALRRLDRKAGERLAAWRKLKALGPAATAAVALRPHSPGARVNLGAAFAKKGAVDEAIAELREAVRLKPDYAQAHHNLGDALKARKDLPGAIASYRRALAIDPKLAKAHCNLGTALRDSQDLAGAIASYRRAIALDPKDANAHCDLGAALSESKDLRGAIARYRRALAIDPKLAKAHNNLGIALKDAGPPSWRSRRRRQARACPGRLRRASLTWSASSSKRFSSDSRAASSGVPRGRPKRRRSCTLQARSCSSASRAVRRPARTSRASRRLACNLR
jgi:tetratricopeptide (TPR) repeat protein